MPFLTLTIARPVFSGTAQDDLQNQGANLAQTTWGLCQWPRGLYIDLFMNCSPILSL